MARNLTNTLDKLVAEGKLEKINAGGKAVSGDGEVQMDVSMIEPDPEQPRRSFSQEKLQSLSDSVKVHGVLQAITVQPADPKGKHLIIMGERRWRAVKLAGLKTIPVKVREATPQLRHIQITENVQREDLTTMEIALAVEQMKKDGMTRVQIAESLGWSQSAISRFAGIVKMPEELQVLARQDVPVLALAELNTQWKKNETATRDFVQRTPVENVTRVSVAELRDKIGAGQGTHNTPANPPETNLDQGLSGSTGEATAGKEKKSRKSSASQVTIVCRCGDEIGRILTDRMPTTNKALMVSFESDDRIEEVAISDIELIEVVQL